MAEPTRSCPRCQRVVLEEKFVDEVCPVCVTAIHSPRPDPTPGKWPPINLGLLSLFCDPFMITSVFALMRANAWLGYAASADELGEYSPWHTEIRSNAIWTVVLALLRPVALIVVVTTLMFLLDRPTTPAFEPPEYDEHAEIMELVQSDEKPLRAFGVCQLTEIAADPEDRAAVQAAMRNGSSVVRACGERVLAQLDDEPLSRRYSSLPVDVRTVLLGYVMHEDLETAFDLLRLEPQLDPVAADRIEEFGELPLAAGAHLVLLELAAEPSTRTAAQRALTVMCEYDDRTPAALQNRPELSEFVPERCEMP